MLWSTDYNRVAGSIALDLYDIEHSLKIYWHFEWANSMFGRSVNFVMSG